MPHKPLTGDTLLDALSEVPGDPAEPVPAPYHGKSLWGWTPNADIPHVVSVPIEAALADLRARLPDDPWSAQYQGQSVPDPGQALDDAARRSVEDGKGESLSPPAPRVITWEPVTWAVSDFRMTEDLIEEENAE